MRTLFDALAVIAALTSNAHAQSSALWRPPRPLPVQCSSVEYAVLLIDVSRSMNEFGRFAEAQKDASDFLLTKAPDCALAVVASFGVTADIVSAEFLTGREERLDLAAAVGQLRATHSHTNLDEAAKLVELLGFQLQAEYAVAPLELSVRAYSDMISAASGGKSPFRLPEYLASRLASRHLRVTEESADGQQFIRVQPERLRAATPAHVAVPAQNASVPATPRRLMPSTILALSLGVMGLIVAGLVSSVRKRGRRSPAPRPFAKRLEAVLVTETAIAPDGGLAEVVARDRRVPIMVGVPVVFSPNLENATYVTGVLPGVDSRELFRIEPRPDGAVHLLSHQSGLTVNDAPIDGTRPTSIDLREAVRIRLGSRLFSIIGSFAQPGHPGAGQSIFEAGPLHN